MHQAKNRAHASGGCVRDFSISASPRRRNLAEEIDANVLIRLIRSQLMFERPTSEEQLSLLADDVAPG
jgi:hypothetical protein